MKRTLLLLILCVASSCSLANAALSLTPINKHILPWGDFGSSVIYQAGAKQVILLLSDRSSWGRADYAAQQLAARGNLVSVLNLDHFFMKQKEYQRACFDIATPLSVYAQDLQQKFHVAHFQKPILLGIGMAAEVAYTTIANLPTGIFDGSFGLIDNTHPFYLPTPLCHPIADIKWVSPDLPVTIPRIATKTPWAAHYLWSDVDFNLGSNTTNSNWLPAFQEFTGTLTKNDSTSPVTDLPLIELIAQPTGATHDFFALILSGDGGWANIDKDIGNAMAAKGINIVGWNSLEYFWEGKNPDIAAKDLTRTINHYRQVWHTDKVLLIGYSMGADVMPFMINHADDELKSHILGIYLLNPSTNVDFKFHLGGWLNIQSPAPYKLLPEIPKLAKLPLMCIYSDAKDSLCPLLSPTPQHKIIELPGDHHFNGDYARLVQLILDPLEHR